MVDWPWVKFLNNCQLFYMLAEYRPQLPGSPTSLKLPLSLFFQTNSSNRHGPMTCTLAPFPVVPIGGHATKFHFIKVLHQQHSSVVHTCISSGSSPHRVECISFRMGSTAPPPTISQRLPAFAGCCFCSLCCVPSIKTIDTGIDHTADVTRSCRLWDEEFYDYSLEWLSVPFNPPCSPPGLLEIVEVMLTFRIRHFGHSNCTFKLQR